MADTIAILMDQPSAPGYFAMVPHEPTLPKGTTITIDKTYPLKNPTIAAILDIIRAANPHNVLIVCHGEGTGLSVRLTADTDHALVTPDVDPLVNAIGQKPTAELAQSVGLKRKDFTAFHTLAEAVRAMRLARLDVRACVISDPKELDKIRRFFGAAVATSPKEFDYYAPLKTGRFLTSDADWTVWRGEHGNVSPEVFKGGRFGSYFFENKLDAAAESKQAVKDWLDKHFGKNSYEGGQAYVHGIVTGSSVIWPTSPDYLAHLSKSP